MTKPKAGPNAGASPDETPDEAAARRRFTQPRNPDPVTALATTPPPDVSRGTSEATIGEVTETTPAAVVVEDDDGDPDEACPCGSADTMTLEPGWQHAVNAMGAHIAIVGCGAPWHYLDGDRAGERMSVPALA